MRILRNCLFILAAGGALAIGLERAAAAETAAGDEDAIRQSARTFVAAFDAGDAKAVAAHFLPEGEFVDEEGNVYKGAEAIEKAFAESFKEGKGSRLTIDVETVRLVGSGLAIEEGTSTVYPAGNEPITESRYLAVHQRAGGKWRIASCRSLERKPASAHEQLKQLAWLVGDWVDESPSVVVEHHCKWSDDANFLLAGFAVQAEGRPVLRGVQRIGWDPVARQVRSWVFDSEGGFAEGLWTRVEDGWVVKMTGVRADGTTASSTNSYRPAGPDRFVWGSVDRIVAGESEPNVLVTIVRAPPEPRPR